MNLFLKRLFKGRYLVISLFLIGIVIPFKDVIIEPSNTPRFILISLILFISILFYTLKKKQLKLPPIHLTAALLGFYLIHLSSCLWSFNVADSLYESQKIFIGIIAIILLLTVLKNTNEEAYLIKSILITSFICSVYAVYQLILVNSLSVDSSYQIHSFFGHKNLLSSFLFLAIAFPIYGYQSFNKAWRITALINILILVSLIFILKNRTVYFATILSFTLIGLFHFKKLIHNKKMLLIPFGLAVILGGFYFSSMSGTFSEMTSYKGLSSLRERSAIWENTIQLIAENPIIGVGSGNWKYNFSKFGFNDVDKVLFYNKSFQRPHNDFLWIFSETGIIGFGILLFIIVYILKHSIPKISSSNNKNTAILLSFLAGLLVLSFFSFPRERITHILIVTAIFGLLVRELHPTYLYINAKNSLTKIIILALLFFNIVMGSYRLKGEYHTKLLVQEKSNNNPSNVIIEGHKASSFFYKTDPTATPISSYIGWGYSMQNNIDSLHYYSKEAYLLSPYDYEVLTNYGFVLEQMRQSDSAKEILLESYKINPRFESTLINLMAIEYNKQNYSEALKWITKIPEHEKNYGAYLIKIQEKIKLQ